MGLFKRGKVWWMTFTVQGEQVRRSTETADRRLAEAIFSKVRVAIVEGRFFDVREEKTRTFRELMDKYLDEESIKKAPRSADRDRQCRKHLDPFFGNSTLAEITPKLLNAYKTKRRLEGAAPATLNKELGLVKAAFNVAIREWEWCRENPVCRVAMERVNNARVRYLEDDEFRRMVDACPVWLKPIVLVARFTGIRRNNLLNLKWRQVDLARQLILLEHTKNGDRLSVPMCQRVVEVFRTLGKVRHLHSDLVFSGPKGPGPSEFLVSMTFVRVCRREGILDFRFHDLRHTFASTLVQRGVDLYRVQRLLGHRDGRMTQRYAHLSPDNLREAIRALDTDITLSAQSGGETRGRVS